MTLDQIKALLSRVKQTADEIPVRKLNLTEFSEAPHHAHIVGEWNREADKWESYSIGGCLSFIVRKLDFQNLLPEAAETPSEPESDDIALSDSAFELDMAQYLHSQTKGNRKKPWADLPEKTKQHYYRLARKAIAQGEEKPVFSTNEEGKASMKRRVELTPDLTPKEKFDRPCREDVVAGLLTIQRDFEFVAGHQKALNYTVPRNSYVEHRAICKWLMSEFGILPDELKSRKLRHELPKVKEIESIPRPSHEDALVAWAMIHKFVFAESAYQWICGRDEIKAAYTKLADWVRSEFGLSLNEMRAIQNKWNDIHPFVDPSEKDQLAKNAMLSMTDQSIATTHVYQPGDKVRIVVDRVWTDSPNDNSLVVSYYTKGDICEVYKLDANGDVYLYDRGKTDWWRVHQDCFVPASESPVELPVSRPKVDETEKSKYKVGGYAKIKREIIGYGVGSAKSIWEIGTEGCILENVGFVEWHDMEPCDDDRPETWCKGDKLKHVGYTQAVTFREWIDEYETFHIEEHDYIVFASVFVLHSRAQPEPEKEDENGPEAWNRGDKVEFIVSFGSHKQGDVVTFATIESRVSTHDHACVFFSDSSQRISVMAARKLLKLHSRAEPTQTKGDWGFALRMLEEGKDVGIRSTSGSEMLLIWIRPFFNKQGELNLVWNVDENQKWKPTQKQMLSKNWEVVE